MKTHSELIRYFEEFQEATATPRSRNERDRDYTDHKQYTSDELSILQQRKQPPVINNRIRKKVNFLRGLERQGRTDPKAYPRTPQHDEDAEAVTDAIRFVADNARFDGVRSAFFENYIVEGTGAAEVAVKFVNNDPQIEINHILWDRVFWDHHSRSPSCGDAKYKGIVIWSDQDDAEAQFKDKKNVISACFGQSYDDTYDDKPVHWVDSKRRRVRIVQMYYLDGGIWHLTFMCKAGFLIEPQVSPYLDEEGFPTCNIELQSAYVDRDGYRFGEPRFMIEQQDAINKRESKMLHLVNQRQTFGNEKGLKDIRQAKAELAKPDGHVEIAGEGEFGVDFGVIPTADMAMGQFTLLQEAKQEIDQTSVNASLTGSDNRDLSGRAIIAQQSGGQVEITPLMDGKRAWELRIYRQVWARIKQFWTGEKWVRVTDDENNLKWVGLNVPVKRGELLLEQFGFIPPQFQGDPRLNEVVGVKRSVSEMDIDLILEVAPDSITIQQEQFDGLVSLASAGVIFPQETYIKASQLRDKEDLLEQLNGDENAQMQAAQEAEQMKQLQQAGLVAEVEKTASEANENNAEAFKKQMEGLEAQSQIGVF